jgi:hypothetical protein
MRKITVVLTGLLVAACSKTPVSPTSGPSPGPPGNGSPVATETLVGAGDIARCGSPGSEQTAALLDGIGGTVFTAGDNAYPNGRDEDFRDCYAPTWGRHLGRTRPSPGNHDYETPGAAGYFSYFGTRAGPEAEGYYAYSLGAWRIFSLNSEVPVHAGSPQATWLETELAAAGAGCAAAYWHRPLFSSGQHRDNPDMRDLYRILYDAGVEFVVTGHDHIYERFARLDPDGRPDSTRGVREFVVGTGGTPLTMPVTIRTGSEVQASAWGVIRFELSPASYRWQFVPVAGGSFQDYGSEECH